MITKEKFCDYINYLCLLETLVDSDENHKHRVSIMKLLHSYFPRNNDGYSELEHYCYYINFGKYDNIYQTPSELYEQLIKKLC
jgi:hypothetical protein